MNKEDLSVTELTEDSIKSMVYEIRGQKVMLDYDLARIYGYSTKTFNQQVKNNIEKFEDDFMFQLTKKETEVISRSIFSAMNEANSLRSKFLTINEENDLRSKFLTAKNENSLVKEACTLNTCLMHSLNKASICS